MADLPQDPSAAAAIRYLTGRHRELVKQLDSLDDTGANWKPGVEMNTIFDVVSHVLDAEREVISAIAGAPVAPEHTYNSQGTVAQLQARIQRADADLSMYLDQVTASDLARDVLIFGRTMTVAQGLALAIGHEAEHVGHVQITRQLWDQRQRLKSSFPRRRSRTQE